MGTVTFAGGVVQNGTFISTGTAYVAQSGTVSAILAGTQNLVKSGSGALTLSGVNSYSGGTTVSAGSLLLFGGDNRLLTSGSIMTTGGVLDLGGNSQTTLGTITFAGGVVQNGTFISTGSAYVGQADPSRQMAAYWILAVMVKRHWERSRLLVAWFRTGF
ncbi:MAG: hypothetical protein EBR81_14235 [Proteobacteria bacterium]|nr:hypothetical protein [Pseudomonadota bacterium]